MLLERFSVSERRACRAIDQPRSTQRRPALVPGTEEEHLRSRLRELARAHPRYGYRRMTTILRREGYCVNHKRIQRLSRDEELRGSQEGQEALPGGTSVTEGTRLRATHPRPCLGHRLPVRPDHQLQDPQTAQHHRRVHQGGPGHRSRTAPSPPTTPSSCSKAWPPPRDGHRTSSAWTTVPSSPPTRCGTGAGSQSRARVYIEPGSPWENPFIESFNGKLRDELLNVEAFETLLEAQVLAEDFRIEYNTYRPHSSLGGLTPFEFAEQWRQNQPGLSQLVDH